MASSTETFRCVGGQVALTVEFSVVGFILLEYIVNCDEQHLGDGDNRFFVSAIRIGYAGNDKRFLDTHATADAVNDFAYNASPQNSI